MKTKILCSILISIFFRCGTFGPREQTRLLPDQTSGCEKFKGRDRVVCEAGLLKELQALWNAGKFPGTIQIKKVKSERKDDLWVTVTYQYTLSEHVKFLILDDEYEPTLSGIMYDRGKWFGSGVLAGFLLRSGMSAGGGK